MTATDPRRIPKLVHVTSVEVLHNYVVRLGFSDGCAGDLDLGPSLGRGVFAPLATDYDLFRQVTVDPEARTLVWPNGADMAPEVLHLEAAKDCPDPWAHLVPRLTLELDAEEGQVLERLLDRELDRLKSEGHSPNEDDEAALVDMIHDDIAQKLAEHEASNPQT